jgi:hypothetical protein
MQAAIGYHLAFLLRERCIDMQREVVAILPELCDDEVHPMLHESTDEVHVARQTVEPRDDQRASR